MGTSASRTDHETANHYIQYVQWFVETCVDFVFFLNPLTTYDWKTYHET